MATTKQLINALEEKVDTLNNVLAARRELGAKFEDAFNGAKEDVDTALQAANDSKMFDYFEQWLQDEKPAKAFILNYRITDAIKVKVNKDKTTGKPVSYELDTTVAMYDIAEFAKYSVQNGKEVLLRGWGILTSKLNLLLHMRVMQDTGALASLKKLRADYTIEKYWVELKEDMINGKTPLTNTQIAKALQTTIDRYLFEPIKNKKGEDVNAYKAVNCDVQYLIHSISRNADQKKLAVCSDVSLRRYICDILNRLVTQDEYGVENGKIESLNNDPA